MSHERFTSGADKGYKNNKRNSYEHIFYLSLFQYYTILSYFDNPPQKLFQMAVLGLYRSTYTWNS